MSGTNRLIVSTTKASALTKALENANEIAAGKEATGKKQKKGKK